MSKAAELSKRLANGGCPQSELDREILHTVAVSFDQGMIRGVTCKNCHLDRVVKEAAYRCRELERKNKSE
jgi:hypothetical protein